jgi:DNA-binding protein H-NS
MKRHDLKLMSADQLWSLHKLVASVLARKILVEKSRLDQQLRQLVEPGAAPANVKKMPYARRPYPQVFPKYRNPAEPSETWAGRGKQPRWLAAQLRSGKHLDDFRIQPPSDRARRRNDRANRKMPEAVSIAPRER